MRPLARIFDRLRGILDRPASRVRDIGVSGQEMRAKTAWRFCISPHDLHGARHNSPESRRGPAKIRGWFGICELGAARGRCALALLPAFFLLAPLGARAEDDRGSPAGLANTPGMRGVVYGFFEDKTGERIGRMRIDSVEVEYRRQGFLRVAWRPLVVLAGVTLDLAEGANWPSAGAQILNALKVAGGRDGCVLRNVRLRLAGPSAREVVAPTATVRADGALELQAAALAAGGGAKTGAPGTLCLWLAGPRAGQLTTVPAAAGKLAASPLSPASSDPSAQ